MQMGTIAYEVQAQFGVVQDVNGNQNTHTYQQQEKEKAVKWQMERKFLHFSWSTLQMRKQIGLQL